MNMQQPTSKALIVPNFRIYNEVDKVTGQYSTQCSPEYLAITAVDLVSALYPLLAAAPKDPNNRLNTLLADIPVAPQQLPLLDPVGNVQNVSQLIMSGLTEYSKRDTYYRQCLSQTATNPLMQQQMNPLMQQPFNPMMQQQQQFNPLMQQMGAQRPLWNVNNMYGGNRMPYGMFGNTMGTNTMMGGGMLKRPYMGLNNNLLGQNLFNQQQMMNPYQQQMPMQQQGAFNPWVNGMMQQPMQNNLMGGYGMSMFQQQPMQNNLMGGYGMPMAQQPMFGGAFGQQPMSYGQNQQAGFNMAHQRI